MNAFISQEGENMLKSLVVLIVMSLMNWCWIPGSHAEDLSFFPEAIQTAMQTDLDMFLQQLPINQGQREQIERVFQSPEYRNMLLFLDTSMSVESVQQLSHIPEPFLLVETLDMLASNLHLNQAFSDWYFSRLVNMVNEEPNVYMALFLRLCQKSDGAYAEWFADPLSAILATSPDVFAQGLQETNGWKMICGILQTGDTQKVSTGLGIVSHLKEIEKNPAVQHLLACMAGENIQE
jgi:hypothetical protein